MWLPFLTVIVVTKISRQIFQEYANLYTDKPQTKGRPFVVIKAIDASMPFAFVLMPQLQNILLYV